MAASKDWNRSHVIDLPGPTGIHSYGLNANGNKAEHLELHCRYKVLIEGDTKVIANPLLKTRLTDL